MVMFPGPLITGPEPVGKRYGLLNAASGPIDLPEKARGGGVRYIPVTCGEAHPYVIGCAMGAVDTSEKEFDPNNPLIETGAFAIYASLECGSVGYTPAEFTAQVERRLDNGEQGAAEYALWTGLAANGDPLEIQNFADDATAISILEEDDFVSVVGAMEDWAYRDQGYGNVAYIHAPVSLAARAAANYLIVKEGNLYKTPYGSIWVFGGGYPGTGLEGAEAPAGGAYLHITGQTTVWRSAEPFTYPVPQTLDRSGNQYTLLSEREYAIGFDCMAGRALFNPLGGS